MAVSFIGGGNRSTRRKPSTCRRSLTNCIPWMHELANEMVHDLAPGLTRRVPLVEKKLVIIPEHTTSLQVVIGGSSCSILSFLCIFCRSLPFRPFTLAIVRSSLIYGFWFIYLFVIFKLFQTYMNALSNHTEETWTPNTKDFVYHRAEQKFVRNLFRIFTRTTKKWNFLQ